MKDSVIIKSNKYGLTVVLDSELAFELLLVEIGRKFKESAGFFKNAKMAVAFQGRSLTPEEEQLVLEKITENSSIHILCVIEEDELKEAYFKKRVEEKIDEMSVNEGQFYKGTLRSGQLLESETSIIVLGDVNPGAKVISKGNVIILGALKGNVYAGAPANKNAFVAALVMNPMQIRIGDCIARSSDAQRKQADSQPKISFVEDGNIYIEPITKDVIHDIQL